MSHLLREQAPITEAGWELLDAEARERLTPALAARKLVDFAGPARLGALGDQPRADRGRLPSTPAGRRQRAAAARAAAGRAAGAVHGRPLGARGRRPRRGGRRPWTRSTRPPQQIAGAENAAVFHGWSAAGIAGIIEASTHDRSPLGEDCERYPRHVAKAVDALRARASTGRTASRSAPTRTRACSRPASTAAIRCSSTCARSSAARSSGRRRVQGGAVLSLRGGDFLFESGQDLSVGYESHDADAVQLYLEESFSFRVATPEAAVALTTS